MCPHERRRQLNAFPQNARWFPHILFPLLIVAHLNSAAFEFFARKLFDSINFENRHTFYMKKIWKLDYLSVVTAHVHRVCGQNKYELEHIHRNIVHSKILLAIVVLHADCNCGGIAANCARNWIFSNGIFLFTRHPIPNSNDFLSLGQMVCARARPLPVPTSTGFVSTACHSSS